MIGCGSVSSAVDGPPAIVDADVDALAVLDAAPDAAPQPPSCRGLAASCGPSDSDDCCATATAIDGGSFYRSYDKAGDGYSGNTKYPASVSDFRLDKYEVTVGRFRTFVEAGMGTTSSAPSAGSGAHPSIPSSGWDSSWNTSLKASSADLISALKCSAEYQTWTDSPAGNESQAVTCLTWYEAMAFCIWDGGYLPTEAEWNYAATGGSDQRAYPWSPSTSPDSTTIECSYANYKVDTPTGAYCVNGTTGAVNSVGSESPSGDGRWGQADLAGNVWGWTLDYAGPYSTTACSDCANVTTGVSRVLRGGSFVSAPSTLRTGNRLDNNPELRAYSVGVRCARAL
ncbi:MAG: formylglycine-generating enzyme family protein [Deltaproteobacteria bacterium]|nr:formylglycine-generating enzyme family protein [Deltaproteobacteria bacterium]